MFLMLCLKTVLLNISQVEKGFVSTNDQCDRTCTGAPKFQYFTKHWDIIDIQIMLKHGANPPPDVSIKGHDIFSHFY